MLDWYPLSFQSDGTTSFPDQLDGPDGILPALNAQSDSPLTDLWILSYGWDTSVEGGDAFYKQWTDLMRSEIEAEKQQNRLPTEYQPMFIGIYWPSIILADTTSRPTVSPAPSAAPISPANAAVATLGTRTDFVNAHRSIFAPEAPEGDATVTQDFGSIYDFLVAYSAQKPEPTALDTFIDVLKKYQPSDPHADHPVSNSVLDVSADAISQDITKILGPSSSGALNALLEFLRVFSFWTMKARAGIVGTGLGPIINTIKETNGSLHIHLVGHSFGAKLLTSAVYSAAGPAPVVDTLILFQGAFSQFAFSRNVPSLPPSVVGPYINIIEGGLVANPVAVIYSLKDLANRNLYPLGMAPILEGDMIITDLKEQVRYQRSTELRGSIGANGMQAVDDIMLPVTLPWNNNVNVAGNIRCINLNRTPFLTQVAANDFFGQVMETLIGAHNDYSEPQIFHSIVEVSRLNRNA